MKKILALITLIALGLPTYVQAQGADTEPEAIAKPPLEITADGSLEWFRGEQKLIARGNAKAAQETSSIEAQTLSANYRDGVEGRFEISEMTAEENVIIRSQSSTAYGDKATYNITDNLAVMTGDDLRMISADQVVTAQDRFEYHVTKGKLIAIGNAVASRPNKKGGKDQLSANKMSAIFKENAKGERVLKTLEAKGNVVINTPAEKITGTYGVYNADTNIAKIKGGVTITRGPNILEGSHAEVDLNTNISRIFSDEQTNNGRVKAVFYPGSNE